MYCKIKFGTFGDLIGYINQTNKLNKTDTFSYITTECTVTNDLKWYIVIQEELHY